MSFLALYIAQEAGYYDYEMQKKTILTNEAMKQFETDIAQGKDVDINNYLEDVDKDYSTNISKTCTSISKKINSYIKTSIELVLNVVAKSVESEQ